MPCVAGVPVCLFSSSLLPEPFFYFFPGSFHSYQLSPLPRHLSLAARLCAVSLLGAHDCSSLVNSALHASAFLHEFPVPQTSISPFFVHGHLLLSHRSWPEASFPPFLVHHPPLFFHFQQRLGVPLWVSLNTGQPSTSVLGPLWSCCHSFPLLRDNVAIFFFGACLPF